MVLELDRDATALRPMAVPSGSMAVGKPARASDVFHNMTDYAPGKAFDDDPRTRWATDAGTHSAWISVDLGLSREIGRIRIKEACGERVRKFVVEARSAGGDDWTEVFRATRIGADFSRAFPSVQARFLRLNILEATEGPTLWEILVFPAELPRR